MPYDFAGMARIVVGLTGPDIAPLRRVDLGALEFRPRPVGVPDECDVADGTSDDVNGNDIPDECETPPNDDCENAVVIGDGVTPFSTVGATTDGGNLGCDGGPVVGFHPCSDNADGCGLTSELTLILIEGAEYLVRVGGTSGSGDGTLTISCEPIGAR